MLGLGKNKADISGIKGESGEFSIEGDIGEGLAVQVGEQGADYIQALQFTQKKSKKKGDGVSPEVEN